MFASKHKWFILVACSVGLFVQEAQADFDPSGKRRKPPIRVGPVGPKGPSGPVVRRDPLAYASIIAMKRPGEVGPVMKLAQLYRERDGSLEKAIKEWREKSEDSKLSADDRWGSLVTLAGLMKNDRRDADAMSVYEKAISQRPDRPVALVALARLKQDGGQLKDAFERYEKAFKLQREKLDREMTIRSLVELSIDLKDLPTAKKWHGELIKANGDSMAVRSEYARTLARKGHLEAAEKEFVEVVSFASGDNRTLPAALLELGQTQIKLQKLDDAVKTLRKGLAVAGTQAGVRPRLLNAIAEAYRAQNKIEDLVKELEKENPGDVDRQELIGKLSAEFDSEKGIKWLQKALSQAPNRVDTRILLIRLLKEQSRIDEAIKEYDLLIRYTRGQPQFVFDLCDLLIGRGERPRALERLRLLEGLAESDVDVLQRLAAYYSTIGEDKRALQLMERLATRGGDDPSHIVDLGDYYYQRSQTDKAIKIWERLIHIVRPKSKGLAALGEVYLDHDLGAKALEVFRAAADLAPNDLAIQKGLGTALEREQRYAEAQSIWEGILKRPDLDKLGRREARTHLVSVWVAQKALDRQLTPLTDKFRGPPVDVESGRMLAEVLIHLRKHKEAEAILREIVQSLPGDVDARLLLERMLIVQGKPEAAIVVLEELLKADPKGARAYYTRLAQYALQLYKDELALRYAASAVELSPEDADGHKKLGEMYRAQQDIPKAIKELRLAIQHNPKLWTVYFQLAELLLAQGNEVEADALYRRVMRGTVDDELVSNAIRLSTAINQKRGSLEVLEAELLPLTLSNPQKPVYRRLLVELYANLTAPLIAKVRDPLLDAAKLQLTRERLVKIGARGVQPLLDALSDTDVQQQRTAIEILGFVGNRSAGAPLFAYATGTGDAQLRSRAMLACGALRDLQLLPRYEELLFSKTIGKSGLQPSLRHTALASSDDLLAGAVFGIARMALLQGKGHDQAAIQRARKLLVRIAESVELIYPTPRVIAVLALGFTQEQTHISMLESMSKQGEIHAELRAASYLALSQLHATSARGILLSVMEQSANDTEKQAAMLAFAQLTTAQSQQKNAKGLKDSSTDLAATQMIAEAVFSHNSSLRQAASIALVALANRRMPQVDEPIHAPRGVLSVAQLFDRLVPGAGNYSQAEFEKVLTVFEIPLVQAMKNSLKISADRSAIVLNGMLENADSFSLNPFSRGGDGTKSILDRIASQLEEHVAERALVADRSSHGLQARAIRWLGRRNSTLAQQQLLAVIKKYSQKRLAVGELSPEQEAHNVDVERLAIEELGNIGDSSSVKELTQILKQSKPWALRAEMARTLGKIAARDSKAEAVTVLEQIAHHDEFAFVRESALRSLAHSKRPEAKTIIQKAAQSDAEERVRDVALLLLKEP